MDFLCTRKVLVSRKSISEMVQNPMVSPSARNTNPLIKRENETSGSSAKTPQHNKPRVPKKASNLKNTTRTNRHSGRPSQIKVFTFFRRSRANREMATKNDESAMSVLA